MFYKRWDETPLKALPFTDISTHMRDILKREQYLCDSHFHTCSLTISNENSLIVSGTIILNNFLGVAKIAISIFQFKTHSENHLHEMVELDWIYR